MTPVIACKGNWDGMSTDRSTLGKLDKVPWPPNRAPGWYGIPGRRRVHSWEELHAPLAPRVYFGHTALVPEVYIIHGPRSRQHCPLPAPFLPDAYNSCLPWYRTGVLPSRATAPMLIPLPALQPCIHPSLPYPLRYCAILRSRFDSPNGQHSNALGDSGGPVTHILPRPSRPRPHGLRLRPPLIILRPPRRSRPIAPVTVLPIAAAGVQGHHGTQLRRTGHQGGLRVAAVAAANAPRACGAQEGSGGRHGTALGAGACRGVRPVGECEQP